MDTPLVTKTRNADRFIVRVTGANARAFDITAAQYAALALPGAGRPPGVTGSEARRWSAAGSEPDYAGANRLLHAEIAELIDRFELGVQRRVDGRVVPIAIRKERVVVSRVGGLTLTPLTTWADVDPGAVEIVSVMAGVLTRLD